MDQSLVAGGQSLTGAGLLVYTRRGSQEQSSRRQEVVIEMEALSSQQPVATDGEKTSTKFGSGRGDVSIVEKESVCDREELENCGTLAFMSSANSITSNSSVSTGSERSTVATEEELENCGTLAFMSSANSIITAGSGGVPAGVQISLDNSGPSTVVCGRDSLVNPDTRGSAATSTDAQRDGPLCALGGEEEGEDARFVGGFKPSASTERNEMKYEAMIKSGNTVGIRALRQLSSFSHQSPPAHEDTAKTPTVTARGFPNPLPGGGFERSQSRLVQQSSCRGDVWEYFPPPVTRSLTGIQDTLPDGNHDSLTSLSSAPALV